MIIKSFVSKKIVAQPDLIFNYRTVVFVVFFVMLVLIGVSWRTAVSDIVGIRRDLTQQRGDYVLANLDLRLKTYDNLLLSGAGLFKASDFVSRDEWREFITTVELEDRYPGVMGIGYAHNLTDVNISDFEDYLLSEGFEDFAVTPKPTKQEKYVVIVYLEPLVTENIRALGYDMYSNAARREAIDYSVRTGETSITSPVKLRQDEGTDKYGLLLYHPLYKNNFNSGFVQSDPDVVQGFVYAPFSTLELFTEADTISDETFGFSVYDGSSLTEDMLLYQSPTISVIEAPYQKKETYKAFNREWTIVFSSYDSIVPETTRSRPQSIIIGGFALSLIVSTTVYLLLQRRARQLLDKKEEDIRVAKDDMLSLASHQLRTPATGVKQYVGMVLEDFVGEISDAQRDILRRAYASNERQLAIINEFLYLAKADAGRIVVSPQNIDLSALVQSVVSDVKIDIKKGNHTVKAKKTKAKIYVFADPHGTRMMIENILSNALKYTPDNGKITVRIFKHKSKAHIEITDSGVGIAEADFPLLFKQFSRIPNSLSNQTSGSGIGLYLAHRLAKLNKGKILVSSTEGRGSTFTIVLPLSTIKNVKNHTAKRRNKK